MTIRARLLPLLLLALMGCTSDSPDPPQPEAVGASPEPGGTAVIAIATDFTRSWPLLAELEGDVALTDILFLALLGVEWRDGRLAYLTAEESPGALARRWSLGGRDSTELRYYLRPDARWSDGQRLTAHDVAFTYALAADTTLPSPRRGHTERLDSVRAESDSVVVFHFQGRHPEMLQDANLGIVPRHIYRNVPPQDIALHPSLVDPSTMVVSGPFRVASWQRETQLLLEPNPGFRPVPHLAGVAFRVVPDPTGRVVELVTGGADFATVPLDKVSTLRAAVSPVRIETQERRYVDFVAYNPAAHPALADAEIRRALAHAVNLPHLIEMAGLAGFAVPAGGPYAPIFRDLHDARTEAPPAYAPDSARALLETRGWTDADGDGIRERNGRPFRFTLLTNTGSQRRADASVALQAFWKEIGVDVRLQQFDLATLFGRLQERNYDAALFGWGVGLSPDLSPVWGEDALFNVVDFRHPEATRQMGAALAARTAPEANRHWRLAAARIAAEQPYTWLFFVDQAFGVRARLRGVDVDLIGPYNRIWEWWIPVAERRAAAEGGAAAVVGATRAKGDSAR